MPVEVTPAVEVAPILQGRLFEAPAFGSTFSEAPIFKDAVFDDAALDAAA